VSNLTDHAKNVGGMTTTILSTSPAKTIVYKDVNGLVRVAGSGVVIAGQPEAVSGITFTTENDRGKTS
jgi:hypothetical protein